MTPDQAFAAVLETAKALFCETLDDNQTILRRKFEEARKAYDGPADFKYSIPVSVKIAPLQLGVYEVTVAAAPSSKAKLGDSRRVKTEGDLVDAMEGKS